MINKKILGACVGAAGLVAGIVAATAPTANANPDWELWDTTNNKAVAVGDPQNGTIYIYGDMVFTAVLNSVPTRIHCHVASGSTVFKHTVVSADVAPIAPSGTRSFSFTPNATISQASDGLAAVCQDISGGKTWGVNGTGIDVTTNTSAWGLSVTAPPTPGGSGVFVGTIAGTLTVPQNAISFYDPLVFGCGTGPSAGPLAIAGSYDTDGTTPTPNTITPNSTPVSLTATTTCGSIANAQMESASLHLSPALSVNW